LVFTSTAGHATLRAPMTLTRRTFEKYGLVSLGSSVHQKRSYRKLLAWLIPALVVIAAWWWIKVFDNFHTVVDQELYRSAQLSPGELENYIEKYQLQSVINLRASTQSVWWAREQAVCESAGVTYLNVPIRGSQELTSELLDTLLQTMQDAPKPALVHCRHGADRAGLASALYRFHVSGDTQKQAKRQLRSRYGHIPLIAPMNRKYGKAFREYAQTENETTIE
jgi:uncharacterized protein (TIGR01244 family)